MIELTADQRAQLGRFFPERYGGHLIDFILDGYAGRALAEPASPTYAILELPEVKTAFLGGDYSHPSILEYVESLSGIWNLFVATETFRPLTQTIHRGKWVEFERYAFSSENLNVEHLQRLKSHLPDKFEVTRIDHTLARQIAEDKQNEFANHHGKLFDTLDDFVERGIGYCIREGESIACVASSFATSDTSIEIQIDTRRDYRGNGLATVAAAYLIIYCLEHNLDPGWDAATEVSAKLAEKLGYTAQGTYTMLVFTDSRLLVTLRNIVQLVKKLLKK